jgi:hypothetical protein
MATPEEVTALRGLLGEPIPDGGSDNDTMFTDGALMLLIDDAPDLDRAAWQGWRVKAANFANLVNVVDGASSREFSDLLANAQEMIKLYSRSSGGGLTVGRTRIGRIVRS